MRKNNPNCNPLYFQEYDERYESHENLKLSETSENSEGDETFYDWYENKLRPFSNDKFRTHLLRQCYYKTLEYGIYYKTINQERTDYQLIQFLLQLFANYTKACSL